MGPGSDESSALSPSQDLYRQPQLQQPKKDTPQLNKWKYPNELLGNATFYWSRYQTFTHPVADKMRSSSPSLSTSPPPTRAGSPTPPLSSPSHPQPHLAASSPNFQTPYSPSVPTYSTLPSPPSVALMPQTLAPLPFSMSALPTSSQSPAAYPPSLYGSSTSLPAYSAPAGYPSVEPIPFPLPNLSSNRIHEIIAQQESRFRDMQHILLAAAQEIETALEANTTLTNHLANLDEALRSEGEALRSILEQEKEKAGMYA